MFLTTKSKYALNAMLELCNNSDTPVKLSLLACNHNIDIAYLERIFAKLKKNGLLLSSKGPGGGYQLAKKSDDIRIIDIMDAVEENISMTRCKNGLGGCIKANQKCSTHYLWIKIERKIRDYFASMTLNDIFNHVQNGKELNFC